MDREKMLQDKEVIEEINRHKWLQSEMMGYDIGFEAAANDWFDHSASAWIDYHQTKNGKDNKLKPKR